MPLLHVSNIQVSVQQRATIGPPAKTIQMAFSTKIRVSLHQKGWHLSWHLFGVNLHLLFNGAQGYTG